MNLLIIVHAWLLLLKINVSKFKDTKDKQIKPKFYVVEHKFFKNKLLVYNLMIVIIYYFLYSGLNKTWNLKPWKNLAFDTLG